MWVIVNLIYVTLCLLPVLGEGERELIYLMKYGYISNRNGSASLMSEDGLKEQLKQAVIDFQAFAGLNQTGIVDPETRELMETPRCGVRDIIGRGAYARRRKRYVLQGSRWNVNELTYRVTKYPSRTGLNKAQVDEQMTRALAMWEAVTDLTFTYKARGSVHIEIRFERYEHGDGDPFDGPGGTLAHAYFPQFGGDVHVDDTEYWTIDSFKGTNMLQTMVHELGHSLGLSHSDVRSAIMAPFYKGWDPNLTLDTDDIKAIQALYGTKVAKPSPRPNTTPRPGIGFPNVDGGSDGPTNTGSSLCTNPSIDTIFRSASGHTYVFQGDQYWRLTEDSVAEGYPRSITSDWAGLPTNIDAAFTWQDTRSTYIFKGEVYWKFIDMTPESGYPKPISEGFPGIPGNVDAAFVWGGNNKIYFFKDDRYWKFDPHTKPHVRTDRYPMSVREWGVPPSLEGAVQWQNGKTYFFKQGGYWRFNDRRFSIDRQNPPFPRVTAEWWFGCPRIQQLQQGLGGIETLNREEILGTGSSQVPVQYDYEDNVVGDEILDVASYDD